MKPFEEYYNSKPEKLTDEELEEWNKIHQSQENKEKPDQE